MAAHCADRGFGAWGSAICIAACLVLAIQAGCGRSRSDADAAQVVHVTDDTGRDVAVRVNPKRVVTLDKNAAEVMRILGVADHIVGVSDWIARNRELWPELAGARNVGKFNEPDVEAIAELRPDLVIRYQSWPGPAFDERLAALGIPVLCLETYRIGALARDVELLARIFDREDKAREYLDWLRARLDEIKRLVAAAPERPAVYLEAYAEFAACGASSSMHERLLFVGGRNIAEDMQASAAPVSPEWILRQQPWAVIKMCSQKGAYTLADPGGMAPQREGLLARTGWAKTPAGRSGRVYLMTTDVTSGPASVVGLAHMARWLHPRACAGLDPGAWHREYLERFQGRPWRGVYVHPAD